MTTRALLSCSFLGLSLFLAACGAGTTPDDNSGSTTTGTGGGATTGTGGAGTGGDGTGGTGTGGTGTGGTGTGGDATGGGGSGGGGSAALDPKITAFDFFMNCQPLVPPDPVSGSFTVDYDNTKGGKAATATIKEARLVFNNDPNDTWTFDVNPTTSNIIDPGTTKTLQHQKDVGSGVGTKAACSHCQGNWSVQVLYEIDGEAVLRSTDPSPVQCAF